MKVVPHIELKPEDAYELAMWMHGVRYRELPPSIATIRREHLFKLIKALSSVILNSHVVPNDERNDRHRDPVNEDNRSRLVDWISGIR